MQRVLLLVGLFALAGCATAPDYRYASGGGDYYYGNPSVAYQGGVVGYARDPYYGYGYGSDVYPGYAPYWGGGYYASLGWGYGGGYRGYDPFWNSAWLGYGPAYGGFGSWAGYGGYPGWYGSYAYWNAYHPSQYRNVPRRDQRGVRNEQATQASWQHRQGSGYYTRDAAGVGTGSAAQRSRNDDVIRQQRTERQMRPGGIPVQRGSRPVDERATMPRGRPQTGIPVSWPVAGQSNNDRRMQAAPQRVPRAETTRELPGDAFAPERARPFPRYPDATRSDMQRMSPGQEVPRMQRQPQAATRSYSTPASVSYPAPVRSQPAPMQTPRSQPISTGSDRSSSSPASFPRGRPGAGQR